MSDTYQTLQVNVTQLLQFIIILSIFTVGVSIALKPLIAVFNELAPCERPTKTEKAPTISKSALG